ncbi:serine-rich adhesin for platelets [Anopheles bellator]|uniref:serine-rich adhesin for platelets n=1 Tax=Anopheles bellator TaxID=139047 RepID=UPI0026499BB8|nr:serine-rich adhesin for platelets [Anopheles bellator]
MPFVQRVVTPKYVARSSPTVAQLATPSPAIPVADNEFEALTNITLSNALRQLASLVFISNQIFTELHQELSSVNERSLGIKQRIDRLSQKVDQSDPKQVPVPESDLDAFVQIKGHYRKTYHVETSLFTVATRSETLREMYEAAAKTPVTTIAEMDRIVGNVAGSSSEAFICTPVLSRQRRAARAHNVDMDIEVSLPTAVQDLRKWTSAEAIGDVTTGVACSVKITSNSASKSVQPNITGPSVPAALTVVAESDYIDGGAATTTSSANETNLDAITSLSETAVRDSSAGNSSGADDRVDHLLPSPAEQCRVLASKFPAETIQIDTSGRAFDRMSSTRKSLVCYMSGRAKKSHQDQDGKPEEDNTVRRRSRLRRPRGKRRNTIAGTDQREIAEVIGQGEPEATAASAASTQQQQQQPAGDFGDLLPAIRSKSGDLLRKEPSFSAEWTKSFNKMSHFNSLKQWGINRLRMMNREARDQKDHDIDDFNIHDTTLARHQSTGRRKGSDREKRLSHDRKPSYSSSERSSSGVINSSYLPASINPVKLRETSTVRRQRRTALGNRDEPHSSSGNWSASSESGRTSIGSEITTNTHPKSSASSSSLNHSSNPVSSSAPPSSIVSRRRFFNTSASSSVTSEGTITPDLQTFDYHDEGGETSSVYSCDTEGYYTSFHVDSGLKTLKEEEPITPLQSTTALSSITSFSSSGNTTVVSQENEYDLYGKGSTSTTTSSAGTICTVLAECEPANGGGANASGSSLPKIPERKSSLTKLNRSNSTASNGTLERSYSSSTLGSTLDSTGTIKRNGVLIQKEVIKALRQDNNNRPDVADGNTVSGKGSGEAKLPPTAEPEQSESSDVECVERTERLKVKTTINTSRIPSMCIITPTNSDDEQQGGSACGGVPPPLAKSKSSDKAKRPSLPESSSFELKKPKDFRKASLLPLNNVLDRIKGALPHLKKSPTKEDCTGATAAGVAPPNEPPDGEYVEISKGRKTPNELTLRRNLATVLSGNLNEETEYVSLNELPCNIKCESTSESFMHLDDKCGARGGRTPNTSTAAQNGSIGGGGGGSNNATAVDIHTPRSTTTTAVAALKGAARVKLDANGRVIFSSDSLKRRKGAHTTFAPGPCVKDVSVREAQGSGKQGTVDTQNATTAATLNDPPARGGNPRQQQQQQVQVVPGSYRSLKRPLVSPRYGTPSNRIVPIGGIAGGSGLVEPPKKTLVATILPNSAKQPPHREARELSAMHSFAPYAAPGARTSSPLHHHGGAPHDDGATSAFPKGAHVNVQNVASYRTVNAGGGTALKPYPEGARSLDRSSLRNWYPDRVTVDGRCAIVPRPNYSRTTYAPKGHEPPGALMATGSFSTPRQASGSPIGGDNLPPDLHSLYAVPNKPKPSPLAVGRSSQLARPMDRSLRSILAEQSELSPIKPCQTTNPFKTSTPSKEDELLSVSSQLQNKLFSSAVRSLGNSPVHSGRSTPREMLEPQLGSVRGRHSWASNSIEVPKTCSDRLGTPKTSLMDFKKLLLAHGTKSHTSPGSKMSAVEMLKKSKESVTVRPMEREQAGTTPRHSAGPGSMTILDMSASPKLYSFRRAAQHGNSSPTKNLGGGKGGGGGGPRSNWRFNSLRGGVISTAIPEANSEEEILPPLERNATAATEPSVAPDKGTSEAEEVEDISISSFKENIFLKEDENNFMKGEVPRLAKSFAGFSTADNTAIVRGRLVKDLKSAKPQMARDQDAEQKDADSRAKAAALETAL